MNAGLAIPALMALALSLSGVPPRHTMMIVDLCGGGKMTIDLNSDPARRKAPDDCCSKACHVGDRRKRFGNVCCSC